MKPTHNCEHRICVTSSVYSWRYVDCDTDLGVLQPVAQKCIYSSHGRWPRLSCKKLPVYSPLPTFYTRGTLIFHTCRSELKIQSARWMTRTRFRTQDLQLLVTTVPSSVARATWRAAFMCPWCLRVGQVYDVISSSLIATSQTPSSYVVSLLLFSERAHRYVRNLCVWLFLSASLS